MRRENQNRTPKPVVTKRRELTLCVKLPGKPLIISISPLSPSLRSRILVYPVLDHARRAIGTLTHLMTIQMLEPRSQRSIDVVILTGEAVLSGITQRVEFVAPVAFVVEPFCRGGGVGGWGAEGVVYVVVGVCVCVQERVPEGTAVGLVVEEAPWEDVGVDARCGVHGVGSHGGVDDGLFVLALGIIQRTRVIDSPSVRSSRLLRSCRPRRRNGH